MPPQGSRPRWWETNVTFEGQLRQLNAEIAGLDVVIGGLERNPPALGVPCVADARRHLAAATNEAQERRVGTSWKAVHDAKECLVETMTEAQVAAEQDRVVQDLDNLDDRTERAVRARLRQAAGPERRRHVRAALNLRNKYWEDHYAGTEVAAARISGLAIVLSCGVFALLALGALGVYTLDADATTQTPGLLAAAVCMGLIGGSASSIMSVAAARKILPEQDRDGPWHLVRPLIGVAAALIVVAAAMSGFLAGIEVHSPTAVLALAGSAGFSEAVLVRVMERFGPSPRGAGPGLGTTDPEGR